MLNEQLITRRTLIKTGGLAAVGTLAIGSTGCDKQDISFYVATITGTLGELKPLLPAQATLLSKATSIAKSFNDAYQDGKFDSATQLFENLVGVINEIIAAAGIGIGNSAKIALAVAGVAMRAIAVLMKQQADANPQVAAAVSAATGESADSRKALIEKMADSSAVDALFQASKP